MVEAWFARIGPFGVASNAIIARRAQLAAVSCVVAIWCIAGPQAWGIDFSRDVRPILSENCFKCHGPDPGARRAELRLDTYEGATTDRDGSYPVIPGDPDHSELIARITHPDVSERMPPLDSGKELTAQQIETLGQWIAEGAAYEKHWSFVPAVRPRMPEASRSTEDDWARSAIDRFVLTRLQAEGLEPSPQADRRTLIRRVSLDLTGLPPTPAEVDYFLADDAPDAYSRLVNRLLDSPHFGERMSLDWLDAARYADTHGFNNDSARTMWRWRDWVIRAFNENLPYDKFVVEQLAGDLLPNPTLDQRIATGFNRNHVINSEGGIIGEEYRVEYVADRVRTTAAVFMGLTIECARCHDHKYDPITQKDYYRLFALFNNVPEVGEDGRLANATPIIPAPTDAQQDRLAKLQRTLRTREETVRHLRNQLSHNLDAPWVGKLREKVADWMPSYPESPLVHLAFEQLQGSIIDGARPEVTVKNHSARRMAEGIDGAALQLDGNSFLDLDGHLTFEQQEPFSIGLWIDPDELSSAALVSQFEVRSNEASEVYGKGYDLRIEKDRIILRLGVQQTGYAIYVNSEPCVQPQRWQHVLVTYDGSSKAHGVRMYYDGREINTHVIRDGLNGRFDSAVHLRIGRANKRGEDGFRGRMDDVRFYRRALSDEEIAAFVDPLLVAHSLRVGQFEVAGHYHLLEEDPTYREHWEAACQAREAILQLKHHFPSTMVMVEMDEARPTFVLERGHYSTRREAVQPAVLEQLLVPLPEGAPRNRLGLARWLTRPDHPLTARVTVNRVWQQLFGTGIVKTSEDFGFQGEWPSHQELIDYLAVEFVGSGWNLKELMRRIVTSATYRQSSRMRPELLERDPENRLLARGPRFRMPAELIRDQALAVSGLLDRGIGGPSVYPYQPEGIYKDVVVGSGYPGTKWLTSTGRNLYRRSIYTFWKRTLPHPALVAFDAPEREVCLLRRSRTNTPLQALVLLNDPTYLEAARKLAERVLHSEVNERARITRAFELVVTRQPSSAEMRVLDQQYRERLTHYRASPADAEALLGSGSSRRSTDVDPAELAAFTTVASILLNLDETITKE